MGSVMGCYWQIYDAIFSLGHKVNYRDKRICRGEQHEILSFSVIFILCLWGVVMKWHKSRERLQNTAMTQEKHSFKPNLRKQTFILETDINGRQLFNLLNKSVRLIRLRYWLFKSQFWLVKQCWMIFYNSLFDSSVYIMVSIIKAHSLKRT